MKLWLQQDVGRDVRPAEILAVLDVLEGAGHAAVHLSRPPERGAR